MFGRENNLDEHQILNALSVYYELCSLNTVERSGWIQWRVSGIRIESIPEHVFSVQQLAWVFWSEANLNINIEKIIAMLSLHETEEVRIGDITPFDKVSEEEKKAIGAKAVQGLVGKLRKSKYIISLIDEFNARQTPEAKFAHLCDKMDCDLRAKRYSDLGKCFIETADPDMVNDARIQQCIANGAKTVADVFLAYDQGKYTGTVFEEVIEFLKKLDTNKL